MLFFWLILVFILGAAVGSFINVCFYRLPREMSLLWPASRCGKCFQPVRWYDNLPLVSYWVLRGRCRACGAAFSVRYFLVELFTGLAFVGLFHAEIVLNLPGLQFLDEHRAAILQGEVPARAWLVFAHHAVLLGFLLVTSLCDLSDMEIPLTVTVTGAVVGLALSACFPWPFPNDIPREGLPPAVGLAPLPTGLYPWPVWYPLPDWLPAGSWRLGLATGLAGALAGMIVLRGVRSLFMLGRGKEGLGMGDADLMMMAGSFVGWQPVLLSFFVAVFPALVIGLVQVVRGRGEALPFGPSLAAGVLLTVLFWPKIGPHFQPAFFDPLLLALVFGAGAIALLLTSFLLRLVRGGEPEQAGGA
jgi:leader peptidase (prepilin peptidase)/N-methyltransferase